MQHRIDDLERRLSGLRLNVDRDAASVVQNGNRISLVDRHLYMVAVACQRLVDRVVDDFIDQVVKTRHAGRADVHAGALADSLQTFENLNLAGVVLRFHDFVFQNFFTHGFLLLL